MPLVPLLELHGLLVLAELDHCLPLVPVEDDLRHYATRSPEQAQRMFSRGDRQVGQQHATNGPWVGW